MKRTRLAALGYVYVVLGVLGLGLLETGEDGRRAGAALFSLAASAFLWFLASLRARLMRYDPEGFWAAVVTTGGAMFLAVQVVAVALIARSGRDDHLFAFLSALAAPAAASVVIASSLGAMRARKISKTFGRLGVAGGIAIMGVGFAEAAASWTLTGTYSATWLGFIIWVAVATTTLLRT